MSAEPPAAAATMMRTRCQVQKSTAQKFCCIHPERMAMQHGCPNCTTLRPPAFRYDRRGPSSALAMLANAHDSLLHFRITEIWNIGPLGDRRHSALMLAARITLAHFPVSSAMSFP